MIENKRLRPVIPYLSGDVVRQKLKTCKGLLRRGGVSHRASPGRITPFELEALLGQTQKIIQQFQPLLGQNGFGMKLHAVEAFLGMADGHNFPPV